MSASSSKLLNGPLPSIATVKARGVIVTRACYDSNDLPPGEIIPTQDAFSVIVQLRDFASHRLWRNGRVVHSDGYATGALAITHLGDEWRCHHRSPFDNVRFHLPRVTIEEFARENGGRSVTILENPDKAVDAVVLNLARSLLPALSSPNKANGLFIEQVVLAIQAHILQKYGERFQPHRIGGLARWQERRAKEFLAANICSDISIADVAAQCNLSRSYFIKAFREATGRTPHRWLLELKIEKAKALLLGPLVSLPQIAIACGFADQAHMTRVFTSIMGIPPAKWRRQFRRV